jgi:putative SOS response-associated peptidase YedK
MCYTVTSGTKKNVDYAQRRSKKSPQKETLIKDLNLISNSILPQVFVSGFSHPTLFGFTSHAPLSPTLFQWGLIPDWINDEEAAIKMAKSTLNARIETILEKPSFKKSVKNNRCIIMLDAFFEYHHLAGKKIPYQIENKNGTPLVMAGIYSDKAFGKIQQGCSIVTTVANAKMKEIHNNPKMTGGPRIPVLLNDDQIEIWLSQETTIEHIIAHCTPPIDDDVLSYTEMQPKMVNQPKVKPPNIQLNLWDSLDT